MSSVYTNNRGIGASLEFKGLKAQYIGYYAALMLSLLVSFAILYIIGINTYICLALLLVIGSGGSVLIMRLNHRYGVHGVLKLLAKRRMPKLLRIQSRRIFY